MPPSEVDLPMDSEAKIPTKSIPSKEVDRIEAQMKLFKTFENHQFKIHGLYLILGCLITYFLIVVLDCISLNVFEWETSALVTSFVELLKFLVSTLIGFVFSESLKHSNE